LSTSLDPIFDTKIDRSWTEKEAFSNSTFFPDNLNALAAIHSESLIRLTLNEAKIPASTNCGMMTVVLYHKHHREVDLNREAERREHLTLGWLIRRQREWCG